MMWIKLQEIQLSQEDAENNYYTFFYSPKYGCFETREYLIGELRGCLFIRYSIFLKKENCKFRGIHFFLIHIIMQAIL